MNMRAKNEVNDGCIVSLVMSHCLMSEHSVYFQEFMLILQMESGLPRLFATFAHI